MTESKIERSASNEFYKAKGLKRVNVTLSDECAKFLESKRKEFSKVKTAKQGDFVEGIIQTYRENPEFAKIVDANVIKILDEKVIEKAGRTEGWRKDKSE